jgi:hypothetical protein
MAVSAKGRVGKPLGVIAYCLAVRCMEDSLYRLTGICSFRDLELPHPLIYSRKRFAQRRYIDNTSSFSKQLPILLKDLLQL